VKDHLPGKQLFRMSDRYACGAGQTTVNELEVEDVTQVI
jgi:hypothetical protein